MNKQEGFNEKMWLTDADQPEIRRLYAQAVKERKHHFVYKGDGVLTNYAKYLIEYWDMQKPKK